jgi:photosystem II stability/assembly factor-like uncharacterized protein
MRKFFFLLASLLFAASDLVAQDWVQTNGPSGNGIKAIVFNRKKDMFVLSNVLIRSTDNASSWTQIGPQNLPTMNIAIAPNDDIYITTYYTYVNPVFSEIWKSTDNGNTWVYVIGDRIIRHLAIDSSGTIYASEVTFGDTSYALISNDDGKSWHSSFVTNSAIKFVNVDAKGNIFFGSIDTIFRSTDTGLNWLPTMNGLTAAGFQHFSSAPNGDNYIVASYDYGFFRTTDGGNKWTRILTIPPSTEGAGLASVTDHTGRIYYVSEYDLLYSDDTCKTWNEFGPTEYQNSNYLTYPFTTSPDSGFYVATTLGNLLYLSTLWKEIPIPISITRTILCLRDGSLIASSKFFTNGDDNSTFSKSTDEGVHWRVASNLSGNPIINLLYGIISIPNAILATTYEGIIYKSVDSGVTWKVITEAFSFDFSTIVQDHYGTLYASSPSSGIFRSLNNGNTWDPIYGYPTTSLALNSKDEIFASAYSLGVVQSIDRGNKWQTVFSSGSLYSIVIDSNNTIFIGDSHDIFRSKDDGKNWDTISFGIKSGLSFPSISLLFATPSGTIFAGTDSGIFELVPRASAWLPYSEGLTTKRILSMTINSDGRLFAGSDGCGVFKSAETFNIAHDSIAWIYSSDLNFDTVKVGDNVCKNLFIYNAGSIPLILKKFTIEDPVPFFLSSESLTKLPTTIRAGDTLTLEVCFHPLQRAVYASEIVWNTDIDASLGSTMKPKSFLHGVAVQKESSVKFTENNFHFTLHPNPISGNILKVSFSQIQAHPVSLSIYDLLGREMARKEIAAGILEAEVAIQDLVEGLYYMRMFSEGKVYSDQFVKN